MNFNLKDLRERKGLSQPELVAALNAKWRENHPDDKDRFTVDMVVRMEKDPSKISLEAMSLIIQVFGVTYDQLLKPEVPRLKAPSVRKTRQKVEVLKAQLQAAIEEFMAVERDVEQTGVIDSVKNVCAIAMRKPKIACMGRPDSGKSSALNSLLGKKILPTNWTPTTSTVVFLKHIHDRPDYAGGASVFVFKDQDMSDLQSDDLMDKESLENNCIASGGYDLLKQYGAHTEDEEELLVGAIVVYVDSDILLNCDLVDLPGFNPQAVLEKKQDPNEAEVDDIYDSRDSMISAQVSRQVDGIIYLSIANSFLYGDDLLMAQSIVKSLPVIEKAGENDIAPFGNLFFVASQALTVDHGNEEKLDAIKANAAKRIWTMVKEHPAILSRQDPETGTGYVYTQETLKNRFFTSELERKELTEEFYDALTAFVEQLPVVQEKKMMTMLDALCESQAARLCNALSQYHQILDHHEEALRQLERMEANEATRSADFRRLVYRVTDTINTMKSDCHKACGQIFDRVIDADHIVKLIDKHGFKKNRKDLHELETLLNAELENKLMTKLTKKSDELTAEINDFIQECQASFANYQVDMPDVDIQVDTFSFDVGRAFAGGLAGAATFGALAAWAATCGPLGGYILVAKAVSVLAALGIHVGGTAAVISAVSAIGGPVVLGIALAVTAAVAAILALGGTWKRVIGNKLVKQYRQKNVQGCLSDISDKFWDETLTAFRMGAEQVEKDWLDQLAAYREKVIHFDRDALLEDIRKTEETIDFVNTLVEKVYG